MSALSTGLFQVVERLYGIQIRQREGISTWHPDVRFYEIYEADGSLCGRFYLDLYARTDKRGGAWMDDYASRMTSGSMQQVPVAYLTCNFTPPIGDQPALLTHDEVITLFHEFGHGMHHMLTRIDIPERIRHQRRGLGCGGAAQPVHGELVLGKRGTGTDLRALPDGRFAARRNYSSACKRRATSSQPCKWYGNWNSRYSICACTWSTTHSKTVTASETILTEVRDRVAVVKPPAFNRFAHGFSHIFGGGYAAGYYSYKWAEVLSADAYSLFEENGIFNPDCGRQFRDELLAQGGAQDAMILFVAFRGREPTIDALLRHSGLAA